MTSEQRQAKADRAAASWAADCRSAARAFVASGREPTEEQLQDFVASRFHDTPDFRRANKEKDSTAVTRYWEAAIDGTRRALGALSVVVREA